MDLNNPVPREWEKYITQSPIGLEVVPDQLYSTLTYVDNVTQELNFFTAVAANQSLSNMTQPGMLPNPQSFLIQCPRIFFRTQLATDDSGAAGPLASTYNDIVLLCNTGRFLLTIGTKRYGPWRLWTMPAGSFAKGVIAVAGAEAANLAHDYAQLDGPLFGLFPHLMIAPLQNFQVDLLWPAAVNLTGNVDIEVLFDGQRARAIQ